MNISAVAPPAAEPPTGTRRAERHPYFAEFQLPTQVILRATPPAGVRYALTSFWEERHTGRVQRTTVEKELTLHYVPPATGPAHLIYLATDAAIRKPDPTAFEKALVALAALYQHLELEVAPTGQLLALRNHAAILQTWQAVQQELVRRSGGADEITQLLLASVDDLLQNPAHFLVSLRRDYAFGWLLPDFYGLRLESGWRYTQPRCFARFFGGADLWFDERLELVSAPAVGPVTLRLHGSLDLTRTDLPAVARQVEAERLAAGATAPATDPTTVRGELEATYQLDQATGWPLALDASVYCQAGAEYRKEYFFRLEQLAAL